MPQALQRVFLGNPQLGAGTQHRMGAATMILVGGLGSALGLVLFAKGRTSEAFALAITATVTGAFVGAARTLGRPD